MNKGFLAIATVLTLSASASAQTINLNLLTDIDLSGNTAGLTLPSTAGNSISAIAWDGSTLYIGGYNSTGAAASTGIVTVTNALTAPTLGTPFGTLTTPSSRGITSLSLSGNLLAVSLDPGSGSAIGGSAVREFNTTNTAAPVFSVGDSTAGNDTGKRGVGATFDPGYNGGGAAKGNLAFESTSTGNGRVFEENTTTGAYTNGSPSGGAIINFPTANGVSGGSTVWRDAAYDPATGNLYLRDENVVLKAIRTGDNSFSGGASSLLVGSAAGSGNPFSVSATTDNENLAFVNSTTYGNFLIANDHTSGTSGQNPATVIRAIDPNTGSLITLNFSTPLANSVGAYDFSFDSNSQTLAISDFGLNQVYIYQVGAITSSSSPEPGSMALALAVGIPGAAGVLRRRARARQMA